MGMFDCIRWERPLPGIAEDDPAQKFLFQTKDTPVQFMDNYLVREDGTLWHQAYDTEDQSEATKWKAANPGKELPPEMDGLAAFCGCMTRINHRWEESAFTGEIRFYAFRDETATPARGGWIEFSSYFVDGRVNQIHLIQDRHK